MGAFDELLTVSVNDHTETKTSGGHKDERGQWVDTKLTYLSWPFAWAEVKKRYPEASYSVWKDQIGRPYTYDEATGYMVFTSVTIEGITHEMWLPVMDGANKAMKAQAYKYTTNAGKEKAVEAATMFDINKTLMRCLVKNLAMFGLGLYIYAGEDLPEGMDAKDDAKQQPKQEEPKQEAPKAATSRKAASKTKEAPAAAQPATPEAEQQAAAVAGAELKLKVIKYANNHYTADQIKQICRKYERVSLNDLEPADCQDFIQLLKNQGKDINK